MSKHIPFMLSILICLCVGMGPTHAELPEPGIESIREEVTPESGALATADPTSEIRNRVTVRVRSARVHEAPALDAAIEYGLVKGDVVSVVRNQGVWLLIQREDGKEGWAHQILFEETFQNHAAMKIEAQPETSPAQTSKLEDEPARNKKEMPNRTPEKVQKKPAQPDTVEPRPGIGIASDNHLMCLNFVDVDIRSALSALAMEREINISTAQDVSGNISVHLYHVGLKEALDAITLAGGFSYHKRGDLYYVYKPDETEDPQAQRIQMRVFKLKYAEVDKVQEILESIPGMRTVKIHDASKTIIVEDTPENIAKVEKVLRYWDEQPRQVIIEAKILEVELNDDMAFGVNWEKIMGDVRIGTGGFSSAVQPDVGPVSPVPDTGTGIFGNILTGAGTNHQFSAALDALQTKTNINILSTPRIVALHGETAKVQVGGQQGYPVTTVDDGVQTQTIEFIDTGTILEITPHIDDDNNILLFVEPSINSARIEGEDNIPVVRTTTVTTRLLLKDGETAFIGGLIQDFRTHTRNKVPVLGSIPLLGGLFKRTSDINGKSELVVLITPRILDTGTEMASQEDREKIVKAEKTLDQAPPPPKQRFHEFLMPME